MLVYIIGHKFHYEIENLCRMFLPNSEIKLCYEYSEPSGDYCFTQLDGLTLMARVKMGERLSEKSLTLDEYSDESAEYTLALCLFRCFTELTDYVPAWGLLTGVRPSKLMNKLIDEMGVEQAEDYFCKHLLVSESKTKLASAVANAQRDVFAANKPNSFSLYVSIPFCPSRCSYCSFVSHSIGSSNAKKQLLPYIDLLAEEIKLTGEIAAANGLKLESVYFGGGTPGILSPEQSVFLIDAVKNSFDLSGCTEFTFESGRADTITKEKLLALKESGVDRISINPQTFVESVLKEIGRNHSVEDCIQAYHLAKSIGFESINMDLIAGLPGDDVSGFVSSVDKAIELKPENITVHSLALKRSSRLVTQENARIDRDLAAGEMIDYSNKALHDAGYIPYYMYRQSRCVGNLENVGWCLPNKESRYNIYMMEEIHTVLACGAGAVTKLKAPNDNYLERIFNFKYPYEYNSRFEELVERKKRITEFYSAYNNLY